MHIGWLAVDKPFQRQGIGGRLLDAVESKARQMGIVELATYTLGDSVTYQPYEVTRSFYWKYGFKGVQAIQDRQPGCPEEIWISKQVKP